MLPLEISLDETHRQLSAGQAQLLDCREPFEYQTARIEGAVLIPMREISARLQEIETMAEKNPIVVYCHHGMRSLNVTQWLRQQGVENVQSMSGGIDAWSALIDATVPRY